MRKWKHTTEAEFSAIKALSAAGVSNKAIGEAMHKAAGTISSMIKHDSLEEYRQHWKDIKLKASTQPVPEQTVLKRGKDILDVVHSADQDFDFKLLNENLVLLANKMEGYAKSCEALTIAIYALRKTANGKESKPFWRV